jgi:hypothetical protein
MRPLVGAGFPIEQVASLDLEKRHELGKVDVLFVVLTLLVGKSSGVVSGTVVSPFHKWNEPLWVSVSR